MEEVEENKNIYLCVLEKHKKIEEIMKNKAIYKQTGRELPYPRVEWECCKCGFKLTLMQGYNPDWESDNYGKLLQPTGHCMKCKREIKVV